MFIIKKSCFSPTLLLYSEFLTSKALSYANFFVKTSLTPPGRWVPSLNLADPLTVGIPFFTCEVAIFQSLLKQ